MDRAIYLERQFELGSEKLPFRIYAPVLAGGEYRCDWTISWPGAEKRFRAHGHDSLAALLLALKMARGNLIVSEQYQSGKPTHFGSADLRLSPLGDPDPDLIVAEAKIGEIHYLNTDLVFIVRRRLRRASAGSRNTPHAY